MKKKPRLDRKNIYMSFEISEWYEREAERLGVSQSNLMAMALSQYIDHKKSLDMGDLLKELVEKIENIEEKPQ